MRFERIKERLRALPEVAAWPDMQSLLGRAVYREGSSVWDYPVLACQAVGGDPEDALPGAAAVFCALTSIHLVDDLLDDDPKGDYRRLGVGAAANLALAFSAAGHRLLDPPPGSRLDGAARALLQESFAAMMLATAHGQSLDAREVKDEEEYWRVVGAKTPPLFGTALFLGALLGGGSIVTARALEQVGGLMGRLIQVSDDVADSMGTPAGADWSRPSNNLAILYAATAEHEERSRFRRLCRAVAAPEAVADPEALAEAQRILLRSGAVSYCAYRLLSFSDEARRRLKEIPLADPAPLVALLERQLRPLASLLRVAGVESPESVLES